MSGKTAGILAWLVSFAGALGGESILLLERHLREAGRLLEDDFRVIAFLKRGTDPGRTKVVGERILALDGFEEARFVPGPEALEALRGEDPDLAEAASALGANPLPDSFEIRLAPRSLPRLPDWLPRLEEIPEVDEVRYRPAQARRALEAQFYSRYLGLVLSGLLCLAVLALAAALTAGKLRIARGTALAGGAGTLAGMGAAALLIAPLRESPWWTWPAVSRQLALGMGVWAVSAAAWPGSAPSRGRPS